jgi:tetratricopeptide (TPR) repeat protein
MSAAVGTSRWFTLASAALLGAVFLRAQQSSTSDEEMLLQAKKALHQSQWKEADRLARAYLNNHEQSAEARYALATALFRENQPRESLVEFTHAAKLQTPSAVELRWVALDYVLLGDYGDADTWMTRSVTMDPNDGESWYGLGRIKYTENRFRESTESLDKALQLMPRSVKVEDNLGLAYEGLNRPEDAIAAYRQAIAWQAGSAKPSEQPLLNLGAILVDQGSTDEALPLLLQAESIAPGDSKIHAALGKLYRKSDDLEKARSQFEQAIALDPKSAGLHFQLGQVYRKQGATAKASAEFARASELAGTHSSEPQ